MCGIAGFFKKDRDWSLELSQQTLRDMGDSIKHRGPDDSDIWYSPDVGIGFSHRRLSIVDLSPAGRQPMDSDSGRYTVVFNGEIYNHLEIRDLIYKTTGKANWRGHSDTETLLAGIELWGLENCIDKCIGMFAIAIYDRYERVLHLIRDRVGEKPLYYGWQNNSFIFASELKAFKRHPDFHADLNSDILPLYLKHNYIPAPHTIYREIFKLEAGTILTLSLNTNSLKINKYWDLKSTFHSNKDINFSPKTDAEMILSLEQLLADGISKQMIADVPLGAFLSGGVDSSTIVALMQSQSKRPIKTFSIGFDEKEFNEAEYAKSIAEHLRTEHTELYVTSKEALDVIPLLPEIYDEPFSDSSQIPTYLVSKMTKQYVTVALSGDAGDELFCGYNRYMMTAGLWGKIEKMPLFVREFFSNRLLSISPNRWSRIGEMLNLPIANFGDKIHKGAGALKSRDTMELYQYFISHFMQPELFLKSSNMAKTRGVVPSISGLTNIEMMTLNDMLNYLPDDILVKVDRAAMAVSLETRVPFLDHRIVEFATSLPMKYKIRNNQSKWIIRQILYKHVPRELIERPKMGFAVPLSNWLKGPLRDWAESLLNSKRLTEEGFFNEAAVQKMWNEHITGKRNWSYHLWDILMFQAWLDKYNE